MSFPPVAEQLDLIATMRAHDAPPTAAEITALILDNADPELIDAVGTPDTSAADSETPCGPSTSTVEDGLTESLLHHALAHPTEIGCDDPELPLSPDDLINGTDDTDEDDTDEIDDEPPPF